MPLTALERREVRALRGGGSDVATSHIGQTDDAAACTRDRNGDVVQVLGAHPWAGASAVALALADAGTRRSDAVVLVDAADRPFSGLVAVTECEFGDHRDGWSVGRRGALEIRRAAATQLKRSDLTLPPLDAGVVVVDLGRCTAGQGASQADLVEASRLVLVCRATIPGVRAAEVALSRLGRSDVVLAAVGARRLTGVVAASAGPGVTRILDRGRLVCFPYVRRLDVQGLDDRPLSKALLASATKVWDVLSTEAPVGAPRVSGR